MPLVTSWSTGGLFVKLVPVGNHWVGSRSGCWVEWSSEEFLSSSWTGKPGTNTITERERQGEKRQSGNHNNITLLCVTPQREIRSFRQIPSSRHSWNNTFSQHVKLYTAQPDSYCKSWIYFMYSLRTSGGRNSSKNTRNKCHYDSRDSRFIWEEKEKNLVRLLQLKLHLWE